MEIAPGDNGHKILKPVDAEQGVALNMSYECSLHQQ